MSTPPPPLPLSPLPLSPSKVWVPAIYASPGMYLVKQPIELGWYASAAIVFLGVLSIWTNYDADKQRHAFRQVRYGDLRLTHQDLCFVQNRVAGSVYILKRDGILAPRLEIE